MNLRQVAFLLIASIGLSSGGALHAQQVQIKGPKQVTSEVSGTTYGPITSADTLWRIASRYRQNPDLSVYQVMMAIYQLNPSAFENENFNYLVDGAILNLPTERYIARVDVNQARLKAQQDDSVWQANDGQAANGAKVPLVKPESAASKDDLTQTKQVIEDKITALDAEQNRQFTAIRQQFAESINSVQSLLDDNRKLIERLDGVDTEITSLRGRVDEELQTQMDQMLAMQNELLAISKQAEAQRQADLQKGNFDWLTDPIFLGALVSLLSLSILGLFAMWLIRRNKSDISSDSLSDLESSNSAMMQSDEMDDLSDALANELTDELDDDVDDDLFGDDDLLDDVLSEELQESLDDALDDEFETFDDLGDENLDPIIEEATDALDIDSDGLLDQDDLDSLFDEDGDEEELLAEIDEGLSEDDAFDLATDDDLDSLLADDDIGDLLGDPAQNDAKSANKAADTEDDNDTQEKQSDADDEIEPLPTPASLVTDEQEKPEISIDELLEQPEIELPEVVQDADSDLISEEMLQNLDKEIANQSQALDKITGELINEIEQLEQMGDMLLDDEPEENEALGNAETQHAIQELDAVSEGLDEDLGDASELEDINDELLAELGIEESEEPLDEQDSLADELLAELEAEVDDEPSSEDKQELDSEPEVEVDIDDILEAEAKVDDLGDIDLEDKSADELLAELEATVEETMPADPEADFDQALEDFEQEFSEAEQLDIVEEDISDEDDEDFPPLDADSHSDEEDSAQSSASLNDTLSALDADIPSLQDFDDLSDEELPEFDDADLDEALRAFDENELDTFDEDDVAPQSTKTNVELDDLPGLGDWLSGENKSELDSIDELENSSFEEILDGIEGDEEDELGLKDAGIDLNALLTDTEEDELVDEIEQSSSAISGDTEEFVDVDTLLNESLDDEFPAAEKALNLDAAFESYAGLGESKSMIDVDGDNGVGAKLDLAQAYIETDEKDAAIVLLEEIIEQGDESQKQEAQELLEGIKG